MQTHIIFVAMVLVLANATMINPATGNINYCVGGTTSWQFDKLTSGASTLIDFDSASAFLDLTNGDSIEIMVKNSVTSTPFTFISFNKNTLLKIEKVCSGATADAGYTYVRLINQFLFLQKTGSPNTYHVCQYSSNPSITTIPLLTLTAPETSDIPNTIQTFYPYSTYQFHQNSNSIALLILFGMVH